MLETLTFALAIAGYTMLSATAVLAAHGRLPLRWWQAGVVVIVTHVAMVWGVRYEWQFSQATRNGYMGFLLFHGALVLIVSSLFAREALARRLIWIAFGIVSIGALGAVYRYDVVAMYRIPVILLASFGSAGLARAWWTRRRTLRAA